MNLHSLMFLYYFLQMMVFCYMKELHSLELYLLCLVLPNDYYVMDVMLHYIVLLHRYDRLFLLNLQDYNDVHYYYLVLAVGDNLVYVVEVVLVYILDMDVADSILDMDVMDDNMDSMDYRLLANTMDRISMSYNTMIYSSMENNTTMNMWCTMAIPKEM